MKRGFKIIMYLLGTVLFFLLIFLIIYIFRSKDNMPNVLRDAESLMYTAELKYYDDAMINVADHSSCYSIKDLNYKNHGMAGNRAKYYTGSILIEGDINNPTVKIWLSDGKTYASGTLNSIKAKTSNKKATTNCNLKGE